MNRKKRVYIASPYTNGEPVLNVRRSITMADYLSGYGFVPFVPLLSHFWHFLCPHPYEFWMEQDLAWVGTCDCLLRMPGESAGADREIEEAQRCRIPVFYTPQSLVQYDWGATPKGNVERSREM